jgi:CheY-like chemotaxis protein
MTIKVLAIDDSRTIRSLVQKVMEDAGFICVCAEDGVHGVARFAEENPDVVITDINMPTLGLTPGLIAAGIAVTIISIVSLTSTSGTNK